MSFRHRLACLTGIALVLGLAAGCEQKASESTATNERSDRTGGQVSERTAEQPGQGGRADADAQARNGAGGEINDAAITVKVESAILAEPDLKSMEINVDTVDGIVTLSGTVESPQHIENAKQAAQTVEGVKSVNNQLIVEVAG